MRWTELKLAKECSENIYGNQQRTAKTWTRHHEEARFIHEREFACVPEDIVKKSLTKNDYFPSRIFSQQESKLPHNSLSSCCCSLFVTVTVCRQSDASISQSKFHSHIQDHHGPPYRPRLRFIRFIKEVLIPKLQNCNRKCSLSGSSRTGRNLQTSRERNFINRIIGGVWGHTMLNTEQ